VTVHVDVVTLFPETFGGALSCGPLKRARELGALTVSLHQLRDFAGGRHLQVDDVPYGGGQGMVLKPEPLMAALAHLGEPRGRRILMSAAGRPFDDAHAHRLAAEPRLVLVCGRYEGVDERVVAHVDEELSIGDYVLSGGELPALVVLDAVARLLPGVLGNAESAPNDSYAHGLLEHPQYTRPWEFDGATVPAVLASGDHAAIARWRREQSLRRTFERRPDLLTLAPLDTADRTYLAGLGWTPARG